jgi:hypothetical protein
VWRLRAVEAPRGSRGGVGSIDRRREGAESGARRRCSNGGAWRAQGDGDRRARTGEWSGDFIGACGWGPVLRREGGSEGGPDRCGGARVIGGRRDRGTT